MKVKKWILYFSSFKRCKNYKFSDKSLNRQCLYGTKSNMATSSEDYFIPFSFYVNGIFYLVYTCC